MSRWHWQDDACWQSCSAGARAQAESWLADADSCYNGLRTWAAKQPLVSAPDALNDALSEAQRLATLAAQLVVVGTGGASLGAQACCALSQEPGRVRFLENCDPVTIENALRSPIDRTAWCIISKSGETVETLATALALLGHAGEVVLRDRVCVMTAAPESSLAQLARAQGWRMLPHPADLGGRYSVFSAVGMLPAAFAGLPVRAMLEAAEATRMEILQGGDATLLPHAAWLAANLPEKPMQLLMGYADRLRPATQWYKQLWAESLGKDGKGGTPVTAIGAIDQHSQLQLYLDGPRDKLLTLWLPEQRGQGTNLPDGPAAGMQYLRGRRMGDVMHATAEATAATMAANQLPLRVLRGALTPVSLAQWMVRQMLETLLVAHLIGVDPYSQPAVESGKQRTRAALAEGV